LASILFQLSLLINPFSTGRGTTAYSPFSFCPFKLGGKKEVPPFKTDKRRLEKNEKH